MEKSSLCWARNLSLKSSITAALSLILAYIFSFLEINLSNFFLLLVYFLAGTPALIRTIEDLISLELNIDVLMTLAAFLSFIIGSQLEGGLLLVLFALSGAMEESVSKKAKGTLIKLNSLAPTTGWVVEEGSQPFQRSIRDIPVGTHLLVKSGEIVPLDGIVTKGSSYVNLAHLTGESVPVSKNIGSDVHAGSYNLDGTLTIKVTKTSAESTLSRIIKLINEAQSMKPKLQRFLDKFSKQYATTIIILFIIFSISIPLFTHIPYLGIEGSVYRALTFLIAASPCALIIATPTAYLSAIDACAKKGILLKGGITLDIFSKCKTIIFDKTGTLTTGNLTCVSVKEINSCEYSTHQAISIAAALEQHVNHPMAKAICARAKKDNIHQEKVSDFKSIPGYGLYGKVHLNGSDIDVKIGNEEFVAPSSLIDKTGNMVTFLKVGTSLYIFEFCDTVRKGTKTTLEQLSKQGLNMGMLTGDHYKSAEKIGKYLGIDTIHADLRPENKLKIIGEISKSGPVAMVGDGINDAPALTRANVGISMGKVGSATAVNASDIVLLHDELIDIPWLYKKAKKTLTIIKQNLFLALCVICLASIPALLGFIPLFAAVILHEGGTVIVGLNSLRLLKR